MTRDVHALPFPDFLGTVGFMEPTPFELTPAQKSLLEALARETGKPISVLIDKALQGLEEQVRSGYANGETDGSHGEEAAAPPQEHPKPIRKQFAEAFKDVPEEELERLPVDGAAQHDHYIYGLPKRSA
jgi:hypothetical protein